MAAAPVKLHVTEAGSGSPALVFPHYAGGSGRTWIEVIARLSGAQRCIAPDLRGWGASTQDCDHFGLEAMADDIAALIKTLGLTEYVLVGHSMGGKISQILAGRRPPGLVGLVLVAPAPPTPLNVTVEFLQIALDRYQSREKMQVLFSILTERLLPPDIREMVIDDTLGAALGAKRAWFETGMQLDITAAAAAIGAPTLVIVGTADQVETEASLRRNSDDTSRTPHSESYKGLAIWRRLRRRTRLPTQSGASSPICREPSECESSIPRGRSSSDRWRSCQ